MENYSHFFRFYPSLSCKGKHADTQRVHEKGGRQRGSTFFCQLPSALMPAHNHLLTLSAAINPAIHFTPADACFASSSCIIECFGNVGFKSLACSEFLECFSVSDRAATAL